jgi:hypothetical protein
MPDAIRIAMWSGPRNLSTAMMRAFSSRPDTAVLDEPFYAHYLAQTGIDHPGRDAVIAAYESDWNKVIKFITGPIPRGNSVWYQKHMAHHMLDPNDSRRLLEHESLTHAFLIRDPVDVISSYTKVHPRMSLAETGLPYQVDLFAGVKKRIGHAPPVIDARDVLTDPRRTLARLCQSLGIDFTDQMLRWPTGAHPDDGNWAPHWYASVYESKGFEPYKARHQIVAPEFQPMLAEARRLYESLAAHKL